MATATASLGACPSSPSSPAEGEDKYRSEASTPSIATRSPASDRTENTGSPCSELTSGPASACALITSTSSSLEDLQAFRPSPGAVRWGDMFDSEGENEEEEEPQTLEPAVEADAAAGGPAPSSTSKSGPRSRLQSAAGGGPHPGRSAPRTAPMPEYEGSGRWTSSRVATATTPQEAPCPPQPRKPLPPPPPPPPRRAQATGGEALSSDPGSQAGTLERLVGRWRDTQGSIYEVVADDCSGSSGAEKTCTVSTMRANGEMKITPGLIRVAADGAATWGARSSYSLEGRGACKGSTLRWAALAGEGQHHGGGGLRRRALQDFVWTREARVEGGGDADAACAESRSEAEGGRAGLQLARRPQASSSTALPRILSSTRSFPAAKAPRPGSASPHFLLVRAGPEYGGGFSTWSLECSRGRKQWEAVFDALREVGRPRCGYWPDGVEASVFAGGDALHVDDRVQAHAGLVSGKHPFEEALWHSSEESWPGLRWELDSGRCDQQAGPQEVCEALLRRLDTVVDPQQASDSVALVLDRRGSGLSYDDLVRQGYDKESGAARVFLIIVVGGEEQPPGMGGDLAGIIQDRFSQRLGPDRVVRTSIGVNHFGAREVAAFLSLEHSRGGLARAVAGIEALAEESSCRLQAGPELAATSQDPGGARRGPKLRNVDDLLRDYKKRQEGGCRPGGSEGASGAQVLDMERALELPPPPDTAAPSGEPAPARGVLLGEASRRGLGPPPASAPPPPPPAAPKQVVEPKPAFASQPEASHVGSKPIDEAAGSSSAPAPAFSGHQEGRAEALLPEQLQAPVLAVGKKEAVASSSSTAARPPPAAACPTPKEAVASSSSTAARPPPAAACPTPKARTRKGVGAVSAAKSAAKEAPSRGEAAEGSERTVDHGAAAFAQAMARHNNLRKGPEAAAAPPRGKGKVAKQPRRARDDDLDALARRGLFASIAAAVTTLGEVVTAPFVMLWAILQVFRPSAVLGSAQGSARWCRSHPRSVTCSLVGLVFCGLLRWLYIVPTRYEYVDPYGRYRSDMTSSEFYSSDLYRSYQAAAAEYGYYAQDEGAMDAYANQYYQKALQELEARYGSQYRKELEDWYLRGFRGDSAASIEAFEKGQEFGKRQIKAEKGAKSAAPEISTGICKPRSEVEKMRSAFGAVRTCDAKRTKAKKANTE